MRVGIYNHIEIEKINRLLPVFWGIVFLHFALIIMISYFSKQTMFKKESLLEKKLKLTIASQSIRVDVVAMPKFTLKELKKMAPSPPSPAPKVEIKEPEPAPVQGDELLKEKKKSFLDLINKITKKDPVIKQPKKSREKKSKEGKGSVPKQIDYKSELKGLMLEGNKISKGTSISGVDTKAFQGEYEQYIGSLPEKIRPNWKLPTWLLEQNLKCRIRVFINIEGGVIKSEIYESSGNNDFDNRALKAIKSSSPFIAPSSKIIDRLIRDGVILGFPI